MKLNVPLRILTRSFRSHLATFNGHARILAGLTSKVSPSVDGWIAATICRPGQVLPGDLSTFPDSPKVVDPARVAFDLMFGYKNAN